MNFCFWLLSLCKRVSIQVNSSVSIRPKNDVNCCQYSPLLCNITSYSALHQDYKFDIDQIVTQTNPENGKLEIFIDIPDAIVTPETLLFCRNHYNLSFIKHRLRTEHTITFINKLYKSFGDNGKLNLYIRVNWGEVYRELLARGLITEYKHTTKESDPVDKEDFENSVIFDENESMIEHLKNFFESGTYDDAVVTKLIRNSIYHYYITFDGVNYLLGEINHTVFYLELNVNRRVIDIHSTIPNVRIIKPLEVNIYKYTDKITLCNGIKLRDQYSGPENKTIYYTQLINKKQHHRASEHTQPIKTQQIEHSTPDKKVDQRIQTQQTTQQVEDSEEGEGLAKETVHDENLSILNNNPLVYWLISILAIILVILILLTTLMKRRRSRLAAESVIVEQDNST